MNTRKSLTSLNFEEPFVLEHLHLILSVWNVEQHSLATSCFLSSVHHG